MGTEVIKVESLGGDMVSSHPPLPWPDVLPGNIMNTQQEFTMSLVNCVIHEETLKEKAFCLESLLANGNPTAFPMIKTAAEFASEMSSEAFFSHELSDFNTYWEINDRREGSHASFEKREPRFAGK